MIPSTLATEADLSLGADMATDSAIGRIDQQVDTDIAAVGEPRIAPVIGCALTGEANLSRGADIPAHSTVGGISQTVDANPIAIGEALGTRPLPHEEAVPLGASPFEPWLPLRADIAARAAVVDIVQQIEADSAAISGAGGADYGRRRRRLRCRRFGSGLASASQCGLAWAFPPRSPSESQLPSL